MPQKNVLNLKYDGICLNATIVLKPTLIAKAILTFINLIVISITIVFLFAKVPLAALFFGGLELFVIKYTLWNIYGEERIILNTRCLSYQHHYGFFTTSMITVALNKAVTLRVYEEVIEPNEKYVRFLFESYDSNHLPTVIYQSVLNIMEPDFEKLLQAFNHLYLDEMMIEKALPAIHLN